MIFVVQTMLNVFGSTDLLPLTGVTLPFVSCGGSSMMACWCLLAYIKASDTRQNAGIAIRLPKRKPGKASDRPAELDPPPASDDLSNRSTGRWNPAGFSAKLSIHREEEEET